MNYPYLDTSLSPQARIDDLILRMSLEEKVGQMMQLAALDDDHERYIERYHIGSYLHAVGDDVLRLQRVNAERSRLKIPLLFGIDAIHGHCLEDETTVFPVQLAMACSWNPDIMRDIGRITANEARASHLHWTFSPVLCIGRDPRWGRTSETFGEDPLLIAEMAAALAEGYQTAEYPIAACAKHYAAYGEALGGRDSADAHISERQMRNVFLPPFERAARAGCKTFMAGYQSLNGIPCSANTWLMNTVLRDEWGYDGVVVTDWNNCGQMVTIQHAASSMKEAVALCLEASNDIFMATPAVYEHTLTLVREGRVSEARINESVRRILKLKISLGLFDSSPAPDRKTLLADQGRWCKALQASQQSLTLVKNTGILPLQRQPQKLLLVGDNADNVLSQLGDWSFIPGMAAYTDTQTHRKDTVTLKTAFESACVESGIDLVYLGSETAGPLCEAEPSAVLMQAAANADAILFCAGDALKQYGEFHDRADLALPGNQNAVFQVLMAAGKPIISIMLMSKPHCMSTVLEHSAAVLIAFNPGAKGGVAITQCLFGEVNPSGRLPISFPQHVGQLPVYYNQAPGWHAPLSPHYSDDAQYIDIPAAPLLAFGEGISYNDVHYGPASLSMKTLGAGDRVCLALEIENRSERSTVEIVQLYIRLCIPGVTSPGRRLLKFQRVLLGRQEKMRVEFVLGDSEFMVRDKVLEYVRCTGVAHLMVGKSSKPKDLQELMLMLV